MSDSTSIEQAMHRLSEIVDLMEGGELSLEESIKLFGEGIAISEKSLLAIRSAQQEIEEGRMKIEEAMHDE